VLRRLCPAHCCIASRPHKLWWSNLLCQLREGRRFQDLSASCSRSLWRFPPPHFRLMPPLRLSGFSRWHCAQYEFTYLLLQGAPANIRMNLILPEVIVECPGCIAAADSVGLTPCKKYNMKPWCCMLLQFLLVLKAVCNWVKNTAQTRRSNEVVGHPW